MEADDLVAVAINAPGRHIDLDHLKDGTGQAFVPVQRLALTSPRCTTLILRDRLGDELFASGAVDS